MLTVVPYLAFHIKRIETNYNISVTDFPLMSGEATLVGYKHNN